MGLLERGEQLATLVAQLGQVNGGGRLVLLSGDAGAGKTALVEAFLADHAPERVLVGRCDDLFAPRPLGPLTDIARQTGGPLADILASGDQGAAFDGFLSALNSEPGPVVVVLEDLQWADEATLDLLRFVTRRLAAVPALVIATHRDDLGPAHPLRRAQGSLVGPLVTRVRLLPLSVRAVRTLVGDRPEVDVESLHARTAGNPFFVTEVLRSDPTSLPDSVRDAVVARASLLSGAARDALDAAAVLGRLVTPDLLCAVGDCDMGAVDECLSAGLLIDDEGRQTFRHELARDAIERAMTPLRRRQLHGRALAALGEEGDVVHRAHHAIGSGDHAATLALATQAADHCVTLGAYSQAAVLYGRALEHAGDDLPAMERRRLLAARVELCERAEMLPEALAAGEELIHLLRDAGDEAELGSWETRVTCLLRNMGRVEESWALLRAAAARLEPLGDSEALARTLGQLAGHLMVSGRWEEASSCADRSLDLSTRVGCEDVAVYALGIKGSCMAGRGATHEGVAVMAEALERAKRAGLHHEASLTLGNMANARSTSGDYRMSLPLLDEAVLIAEQHELRTRANCLRVDRAEVLIALGRWDDAIADVAAVLNQPGLSEKHQGWAGMHLGHLRSLRGDPGAREVLERSLPVVESTEEGQLIVPMQLVLAEHAWVTGDDGAAAAHVAACMEHVPLLEPGVAARVAVWAHRTGVAWPGDQPLVPPAAWHVAGDVATVAAYWDERSCPYLAADALGDSDDLDELRSAHERLVALGAQPRAQMVARRLRDLGARDVPRGPRATTRANAAGLTAREQEVAALLAAGSTNAAIARQLVLSPKTVDHHVSAVLAKLGVRSRRQVGAAAAQRGLDLAAPVRTPA